MSAILVKMPPAMRSAAAVGHGYRQLRPGVLVSPYDRSAGFLPAFPGVVAGQLRLSTEAAAVVAERCWDLAASAVSSDFTDHRTGPATEVVPAWVAEL